MAVELRVIAPDGTPDAILPDWSDLTFSQDFDPGTLTFTYALKGRAADLLQHSQEVVALLDGQEPPDARFFITQGTGSHLAESDEAATRTWNTPSLRSRFDKLNISPSLDSTVADSDAFAWTNYTPGKMLRTALDNAASRARQLITPSTYITSDNPFSWLNISTLGFTDTTDSSGTPWPASYDYTPEPGATITDLLTFFTTAGIAQARMQGHTLQLYATTTFGRDLTTGSNPVVLASGRDLTDSTYQTDSTDLVNALMVIGDTPEGQAGPSIAWVYDKPSIAQFGYREGTLSVSGINTQTMLKQAGNAYLSYMKMVRYSYTYTTAATYLEEATNPYNFRPFMDFQVGDTILLLDGDQFISEKVRLLSASWPSSTSASVALTVNDFFAERQLLFESKIASITGSGS